jgi:NHL repeat
VFSPGRAIVLLAVASSLLAPATASAFEPLLQFGTGTAGSGPGELAFPEAAVVGSDGSLFVSDSSNSRIAVFGPDGGFQRNLTGGDLQDPAGAAFGPEGNLYVSSATNGKVVVVAPGGGEVSSFGSSGDGAGNLDSPEGVAISPSGEVYVAEFFGARVSVFSAGGQFLRAFGWDVIPGAPTGFETCTTITGCQMGTVGNGAGQLRQPRQLGFAPNGNLYVADEPGDRLDVFAPGDVPAGNIGSSGSGPGALNDPSGVAFGADGSIYVPERTNNRVSVFDAGGTFQRAFGWNVIPGGQAGFSTCTADTGCQMGTAGTGAGQFDGPFGVATDCRGAVYVAEEQSARVEKLGDAGVQSPPCPPPTPATKPSNAFSFGKLKRNRKRGTAVLSVSVPDGGTILLGGKGLVQQRPLGSAAASKTVSAAGTVKLRIKSKGAKKRKLNHAGKVKVKAVVTFTPTGGDPNSQTKKITLIKKSASRG